MGETPSDSERALRVRLVCALARAAEARKPKKYRAYETPFLWHLEDGSVLIKPREPDPKPTPPWWQDRGYWERGDDGNLLEPPQWTWLPGKAPPPGFDGMPPSPPVRETRADQMVRQGSGFFADRGAPTTPHATPPDDEPTEPFNAFGWVKSWDEHQKQAFAVLLFLAAIVFGALLVLLREVVLRSVLGFAYIGAAGVLLWLLSTLPRSSRRLWLAVGSVLVVAGAGSIIWLVATQGVHSESSAHTDAGQPSPAPTVALSPVMTHHPVLINYADIDGTGRRIYVRDRLDNTTNDVITYEHYGKAILARPARNDEDALTILEPLREEVRRLASGGGAVVSSLEPMAGNVPIYIMGPHPTEKQWRDFLAGRTRLYYFDLIYPKTGDKRRFVLPECGIGYATKYGFDSIPHCPEPARPGEI